jgi:hypothetical protein
MLVLILSLGLGGWMGIRAARCLCCDLGLALLAGLLACFATTLGVAFLCAAVFSPGDGSDILGVIGGGILLICLFLLRDDWDVEVGDKKPEPTRIPVPVVNGELQVHWKLTAMAEALRPMCLKLTKEIDAPAPPTVSEPDMLPIVQKRLIELDNNVSCLADELNKLFAGIVQFDATIDVRRPTGVFEAFLNHLIFDYRAICSLKAHGKEVVARDLLVKVYRHTLVEIRDWLQEFVEAVKDPLAASKKRGLPMSGQVDFRLTLTLTDAPELSKLSRWVDRQPPRWTEEDQLQPEPATGQSFFGTVFAAALGWGIGHALFGGKDD